MNELQHGKRLNYLLTVLNIEKQELAQRLNVPRPSVSQWLKQHTFSPANLQRICEALRITQEQFLGSEPLPNTEDLEADTEKLLLKQIIEEKERLIQILLANQKKCL